jgi:hypothetical protein
MSGLAKFTRPGDRQTVWISAAQVCSIIPASDPPDAKTTIMLAQGMQSVIEMPDVVAKAIEAKM